jgi:hypothetical protein
MKEKFEGSQKECEHIKAADKFLDRIITRCILFGGENISFDASLFIYINSPNISPIMMIQGCS